LEVTVDAADVAAAAPSIASPPVQPSPAATSPSPEPPVSLTAPALDSSPPLAMPAPEDVWQPPVSAAVNVPITGGSFSVPNEPATLVVPSNAFRAPAFADVELLDRAAGQKAGARGLAFRVSFKDSSSHAAVAPFAPVQLRIDYRSIANRFGADFPSRLRPRQVPECALADPVPPDCAPATELVFSNDTATSSMTVTLPRRANAAAPAVAADDTTPADSTTLDSPSSAPQAGGSSTTVVALASSATGPTGDFSATPLAPLASYQVGLQSGDFTASYPLAVPPPRRRPGAQHRPPVLELDG
jgi:hypothetical protein